MREALLLNERYSLTAGIDCSDGLSLDASRLAEESKCGVVIDLDAVPISDAARDLAKETSDGRSALDRALGDGEDFELILAAPPDEAEKILAEQPLEIPLTRIGHFIEEVGLWQGDGERRAPLQPKGYEHA